MHKYLSSLGVNFVSHECKIFVVYVSDKLLINLNYNIVFDWVFMMIVFTKNILI